MLDTEQTAVSPTIQLLVLDLDGTLLNSQDKVSETNRQAIRNAVKLGVVVAIASGRMRQESQFVLDELPEIRYFIGMNGSLVEDLHTGSALYDRPLPKEKAEQLIDKLENAGLFYQIYARGGAYISKRWVGRMAESGMSEHYLARYGDKVQEWTREHQENTPVYKMLAVTGNKKETVALLHSLFVHDDSVKLFCSLPDLGYYEIVPRGIDKAKALAFLCQYLGIASQNVLAMGDSENDLCTLRFAGQAAVVANATPILRQTASYFALSNDQDGVADAIQHYIYASANR